MYGNAANNVAVCVLRVITEAATGLTSTGVIFLMFNTLDFALFNTKLGSSNILVLYVNTTGFIPFDIFVIQLLLSGGTNGCGIGGGGGGGIMGNL